MKKPRTGGSGASRVPWGEPVMARGSAITLLAYAFYGSLYQAFCLKAALKPISRNVSLL